MFLVCKRGKNDARLNFLWNLKLFPHSITMQSETFTNDSESNKTEKLLPIYIRDLHNSCLHIHMRVL